MADFTEAKTRFTTKDKITPSFRDMDRGAKRFGRSSSKSFRDATSAASRFRDVTKGILAAGIVQRGISGLTQGLRGLTTQFIDFDKATIGAAARFKDIGPDAVDFEQQLRKIRDRAREAGATTEFTAAQSAEALNFLAKAGFKSTEAFGSLDSMINLATATGEDFATVADFSSDLLGAFGLNVDNTAQKIQNLARLNDVLVKAANTANVTVEDLFETMKIAAPVGTALGQSLESVTAVTAFLGGAGIKGSQAATALKNSFLKLAAPSSAASKMIRGLGIQVADSNGNMRQLNEIIGDLAPELDKMGNVKAAKVLNEIFGKRAIAGAINIGEGTEAIRQFEKSLLDAGGTAQATADRLRKALGNRLLALQSAATELGFKFIEAFEIRGENAVDALTNAIRKFDPAPMIEGLRIAVDIFKGLWTVLKPFMPFMPWFIGAWIAFGVTMKILAIAKMVSGFLLFWNAIRNVAGGMAILNAVMAANPVGAVILAITALIGLLFLVVKNWDKIKDAFGSFVASWKRGIASIGTVAEKIFGGLRKSVLPIIEGLSGAFSKIAGGLGGAFSLLIGREETEKRQPERTAPNKEEAEARRDGTFKGRIDIAGAPTGTTVESETTGAPNIDMALLGGT